MSNVIELFKRNRKYQIGGPLYSPSELPTQALEQLARANGGKLNKNNINDNTEITTKQLVLSIEDDPNISIIRRVNSSPADFVQRLKDPNRKVIKLPNGQVATHKMGWATVDRRPVAFPLIQNINGKLVDFENKGWAGLDSAINRGDTIHMTSPQEAEWFTTHYKNYYPSFNKYADGRKVDKEITAPIKYHVIPKSDDPVAVNFLANWLNNRRGQLYNKFWNKYITLFNQAKR